MINLKKGKKYKENYKMIINQIILILEKNKMIKQKKIIKIRIKV